MTQPTVTQPTVTQPAEASGPRGIVDLARAGDLHGILVAARAGAGVGLTFTTTGPAHEPLVIKVGATPAARPSLEAEGRMLVELRRMPLGQLGRTVPRYVRTASVGDRPALVATALPGTPMSIGYRSWHHTARPTPVRRDFQLAGAWLRELQDVSARRHESAGWTAEVIDALGGRWDGHPLLDPALARLAAPREHLGGRPVVDTVVHGDFWVGNILVGEGGITGVVGWKSGKVAGCPLSDLTRFALGYCFDLDRTARPGARVPGHPGLRRVGFAPGIRFALLGRGWLSREVRRFLGDGLQGLGLPRWLWYDAALTGIGELAVSVPGDLGVGYLELLASMPIRPGPGIQ